MIFKNVQRKYLKWNDKKNFLLYVLIESIIDVCESKFYQRV